MDTIAALDAAAIESWLAQDLKFRRLAREAGLPEEFYQKTIDDKEFRLWFVQAARTSSSRRSSNHPRPSSVSPRPSRSRWTTMIRTT